MNASPAMDTGAPLFCHGAVGPGPGGERRVALRSSGPVRAHVGSGRRAARRGRARARGREVGQRVRACLQYRRVRWRSPSSVSARPSRSTTTARRRLPRGSRSRRSPVIERVADAGGSAGRHRRRVSGRGGGDRVSRCGPISDVRASADYRRAMARVIGRRGAHLPPGAGRGRRRGRRARERHHLRELRHVRGHHAGRQRRRVPAVGRPARESAAHRARRRRSHRREGEGCDDSECGAPAMLPSTVRRPTPALPRGPGRRPVGHDGRGSPDGDDLAPL